ncbi:MAG: ABC-2 family transporter protein [Oscillospiraceae bacterium]|nr:ABC-2 family transporter protein [Oscillospiraceae bacterium]
MGLYFKFFAMHLKSQMQYKVSFFMTMLGQFLTSFLGLIGIYFMFSLFNEVAGFTFAQVLLCFAIVLIAFTLAEMFGRGFDLFPRMLGNGEFDRALVRPRNVIFQVLASKMEFARIGRLVQSVVVLIYALSTSGIVWTWDNVLTLVLMIVCGSLVFFGLFVIYAAVSFFTVEGLEFMNILTDGGREFGRYPFVIYGEGVLRFLTYVIPLALFQYWPLLYLLGMEESMFYMFTPLLSLLFLLPCYVLFRVGLRRYKSTGS